MRSNALQERERVADPIGGGRGESGGGEHGVDGDNLLQQSRDRAARVPQDGGEVRERLALLHKSYEARMSNGESVGEEN